MMTLVQRQSGTSPFGALIQRAHGLLHFKNLSIRDHPDLRIAITGSPSVVCPHCKVATRFRHDQIERRQVVLTH
jgi:hypothetical protein